MYRMLIFIQNCCFYVKFYSNVFVNMVFIYLCTSLTFSISLVFKTVVKLSIVQAALTLTKDWAKFSTPPAIVCLIWRRHRERMLMRKLTLCRKLRSSPHSTPDVRLRRRPAEFPTTTTRNITFALCKDDTIVIRPRNLLIRL